MMPYTDIQPDVLTRSDKSLQTLQAPSASVLNALPMADSNHGTYFALHTFFGRGVLPRPETVRSSDPVFNRLCTDIDALLQYRPDQIAHNGTLDQQRNLQVNRLTCALAMLSCRPDLPGEQAYCRRLICSLLADRGLNVRARPDDQIELDMGFEPDFLNLYRAAAVKFTDASVAGMFNALLGGGRTPFRTDPELVRLMTIVCDRFAAKEASSLLNGLLRAHQVNAAAFAKLGAQGTIVAIIRKFGEHEIAPVIKAAVIFIVQTALKNQADILLQEMVAALEPASLRQVATSLAKVLALVPKVHPELISSMLKALRTPAGLKTFLDLLGVLSQPPGVPQQVIAYDAQGVTAALFDAGLAPAILRPFLQRISRLELCGELYARLTDQISVLRDLLEQAGPALSGWPAAITAERSESHDLLPLLQLGLVRYQGEPLDYFVSTINTLATGAFRAADFDLIVEYASAALPGSLDHLATPESSGAAETSGPLATALAALWAKIELRDEALTAADLSRKLRIGLDGVPRRSGTQHN